MAGSQLIRGIMQFGRNYGFEFVAQKVEREVRFELYSSLLGKSMTFHNLQPVGDTMARATNDVREVNYMFSPGVNVVVGSLNFLIMPLIFSGPRYHPALCLPRLFSPSCMGWLCGITSKRSARSLTEVRASFGVLNTRLAEALDGIEIVKGSAQENAEVERFGKTLVVTGMLRCVRVIWKRVSCPSLARYRNGRWIAACLAAVPPGTYLSR